MLPRRSSIDESEFRRRETKGDDPRGLRATTGSAPAALHERFYVITDFRLIHPGSDLLLGDRRTLDCLVNAHCNSVIRKPRSCAAGQLATQLLLRSRSRLRYQDLDTPSTPKKACTGIEAVTGSGGDQTLVGGLNPNPEPTSATASSVGIGPSHQPDHHGRSDGIFV